MEPGFYHVAIKGVWVLNVPIVGLIKQLRKEKKMIYKSIQILAQVQENLIENVGLFDSYKWIVV